MMADGFFSEINFCSKCGSVLPLPNFGRDFITCANCSFKRNLKDFDDMVEEFVIHFNKPKKKKRGLEDGAGETQPVESQGPTVERQCPRCQNDIMTYTTRQTRSADEGQTVFYTCIKCKFQDIEYS